VCSVLRGRIYECTQRMDGKPCQSGYDSHSAERGQEFVLFHGDQVCPIFVIEPRTTARAGSLLSFEPSNNNVADPPNKISKKSWFKWK
jgi:hypothetical protein